MVARLPIILAALVVGAPLAAQPLAPGEPEPMTRADAEAHAARIHAQDDRDHDGFVTRAEAQAVIPAATGTASPPLPPVTDAMFAAADANGDGRIDHAEATAGAARTFDAMDIDHDGFVTAAERRAYFHD